MLYIVSLLSVVRVSTFPGLNSRNIVLLVAYFHALHRAFDCVKSWLRHAARKLPDCGTTRGTHIKVVDKRKGALIVRRSSIHKVGGYGYTYVLRCIYTTCAHGHARPVRVHTRDLSRVWNLRVVTTESLDTAMHGYGIYIGGIVRGQTEKKKDRERERDGKSSPDLPQARDRNSR